MSRACVRRGEEAWLSVDKDSKTLLPVLYINLDQDKDRRAHILETLAQDEDNLRLMRVAALEPPIALPGAAFADTLAVGEIGCYASHMKAWDALLASRSQFAVVLEDDARVPPNLADLVQEMIAVLPKHWSTFTIARNILHDL